MRKIVLPTDFSENSLQALKYAVELFKHETSEIYLLHTFADEVYAEEKNLSRELFDELKIKVQTKANNSLDEFEAKIKDYSPNPRHKFIKLSIFGSLVDEVNDLINRENADITVMGTRGCTNNRSLSFGSNTLMVLKYVQCPVLAIPVGTPLEMPRRILFPTNYIIPYQKRELKLVACMAQTYRASIHMLYISKFPLESYRQKDNQIILKEQFVNLNFQFHQIDAPDKTQAILDYIDTEKIDLLIMVNGRHTYLEDILFHSTIDRIGLEPKIPFLVLQNYNREIL
ncbi:universal stress protein [Salegentibacter sp. HM20]